MQKEENTKQSNKRVYHNTPLNEDNNRKIFHAEKILSKKVKKGITYYKIKWINKDKNDDISWEPESSIIDKQLILNYQSSYPSKQNKNLSKKKDLYLGNIEYDEPLNIIRIVPEQTCHKRVAVLVEWKMRSNGILPKNSVYLISELEKKHPLLVIHWLEKFILLNEE